MTVTENEKTGKKGIENKKESRSSEENKAAGAVARHAKTKKKTEKEEKKSNVRMQNPARSRIKAAEKKESIAKPATSDKKEERATPVEKSVAEEQAKEEIKKSEEATIFETKSGAQERSENVSDDNSQAKDQAPQVPKETALVPVEQREPSRQEPPIQAPPQKSRRLRFGAWFKRLDSFSRVALVICIILMITAATVVSVSVIMPKTSQPYTDSVSATKTIDEDNIEVTKIIFKEGKKLVIDYKVDVESGPNVDVVVLRSADYERLINKTSFSFYELALNASSATGSATFYAPDAYYVVIENGDRIADPDAATPPGGGWTKYWIIPNLFYIPVYKEDINDPATVTYEISITVSNY